MLYVLGSFAFTSREVYLDKTPHKNGNDGKNDESRTVHTLYNIKHQI